VIIGVALEGPELVHGTISISRRKFGRVDSAEQHHLPDWIALLGLFGWFLVVLGVAGEYVTDAMVSKADGNIQTFNDIMLTGARKDTALAFERASHAETTARGFEAQIAESGARAKAAEARSAEASAKAESFRLEIAKANESASKAEARAAASDLARVELEAKVAWRTLTKEQQQSLVASLSKFSGQLGECSFLYSDMEAFSFASEIATALRAAKWRVVPPNPYMLEMKETSPFTTASPIGQLDLGIEVVSTPDAKAVAAAGAIVRELGRLGFDVYFNPTTQRPPSRVWVTVQHRPLGPQGEAKLRAEAQKNKK
jgi:hypothetical protein